jgi:hypothetical protein
VSASTAGLSTTGATSDGGSLCDESVSLKSELHASGTTSPRSEPHGVGGVGGNESIASSILAEPSLAESAADDDSLDGGEVRSASLPVDLAFVVLWLPVAFWGLHCVGPCVPANFMGLAIPHNQKPYNPRTLT